MHEQTFSTIAFNFGSLKSNVCFLGWCDYRSGERRVYTNIEHEHAQLYFIIWKNIFFLILKQEKVLKTQQVLILHLITREHTEQIKSNNYEVTYYFLLHMKSKIIFKVK